MTSTTGEFAWETSNIQQEQFAALTFLLSGRRGCQIEPPRMEDSNNPKMEEDFLDRLAELLTIRPEPRFITGTALRRTADGRIEVVVARNSCLNEPKDARFFEQATKWMQSDESPTKDDDFLKEILSYCSYRIAEIKCSATRIVGDHDADEPRTDIDDLEKLSGICARDCITVTASEEMANLASRIAKSKLSLQLRSSGPTYRKLDRTIEYLSHIRELFAIFKDFRKRIRGSKSFSIVLLDPPPLVKLRKSKIEFADILKDLGVPIDTVPKCASKQWIQDHGLRAHAEIQIVLYAMEKGIGEFDPYIGCTLPSCFLCSKFLGSLCQLKFRTRGTHGRLYPHWTVPTTPNIPLHTVDDIERSLKAVYEQVKLCLEEPTQRCENCPLRYFKDTGALAQHCSSKDHGPVAFTWSAGTPVCLNCPFREFRDMGTLTQHCVAQNHTPA